jgi:hypothetical protein
MTAPTKVFTLTKTRAGIGVTVRGHPAAAMPGRNSDSGPRFGVSLESRQLRLAIAKRLFLAGKRELSFKVG